MSDKAAARNDAARNDAGGGDVGSAGTVYEAVGGRPFFDALVDRFYEGVATDPVLRPLYPDDLQGPKEHLAGFLAQYWGGGSVHYSADRGHPRLRMRHAGFVVGEAEKDAWLAHMTAAVAAAALDSEVEDRFLAYFEMAAAHLVNR